MWSGDPRAARRVERHAHRGDRHAYKSPFNKLVGLFVLVVFLVFAFFAHFWVWLLLGILALFIGLIVVRGGFSGLLNQRFSMPLSQRPQQTYAPYEQTQTPYAPYAQGHQPQETYPEGDSQFRHTSNQAYESPQAQYPQQGQLPPQW